MNRVQHIPTETELRRDLAACYRLVAHFGWDDLVATHISARLPGEETFLINPFGLLFEEVTASNLVKVDMEGNKLDGSPHKVNRAGFVIHSAIHQSRPDVQCVMHLHTKDGVAVSATRDGLLPLNQTAMTMCSRIAFHDFEGIALDMDERARLQADLGQSNFMLLRNHGTLTVGPTIASAFYRMYGLEWACTVQVRTLSMGRTLNDPPQAGIDKVTAQTGPEFDERLGKFAWPALLRKVQRLYPDFAA